MKQKFFLLITAIISCFLSVEAQNGERVMVNAGMVEHITIARDLNVILVPGENTDNSLSIDAKASKKLDVRLFNGMMTLASENLAKGEQLTVYLYVMQLKSITVDNNASVKTIGVLDTPMLDVYIEGIANVHLKTNGEVKAHSLGDSEIQVKYISQNLLAKQP